MKIKDAIYIHDLVEEYESLKSERHGVWKNETDPTIIEVALVRIETRMEEIEDEIPNYDPD